MMKDKILVNDRVMFSNRLNEHLKDKHENEVVKVSVRLPVWLIEEIDWHLEQLKMMGFAQKNRSQYIEDVLKAELDRLHKGKR